MTPMYRITHPAGRGEYSYTLEVRRYRLGPFGYWNYVSSGTDEEMHKLLDEMIRGDHDPLYFDAEGTML